MKTITKELLEKLHACKSSLDYVCNNGYIGLTYEKGLRKALKEDRFSDANWFIIKIITNEQKIKYAIYAAELVLDIFETNYPNNDKPRKAIEAAKEYLKNPCKETKKAAYAAANAAYAAAYAAAKAAAYSAAKAAAYSAYSANAADAADAAAYAAYAADAAAYAAYAAYNKKIKEKIIEYGISLINENK